MSASGHEKVFVDALTGDGRDLTRRYAISSFERLAGLLATPAGEAVATFAFKRLKQGMTGCELRLSAAVTQTCQRCLEPVELPLEARSSLAFVPAEGDAAEVPAGYEAIPVAGGRLDLRELVEDELLLSLPVVALHPAGTPCAAAAQHGAAPQAAAPQAETQRPFADLKDLLKH